MKRTESRTRTAALAATLVAVALGSAPSNVHAQGAERQDAAVSVAPNGPCRIAGTWIGSSPPFLPELGDQPLIFVETITPLDSTCQRFASVLTPINPEVTFSGLFPEATTGSSAFGALLRTAPGEYGVHLTSYFSAPPPAGAPVRGPVVYFWNLSGKVSCLDEECTTKLQDGFLSLYSNTGDPDREFPPLGILGVTDQDADDDGFADPGAVPILSAPFPLTSRRVDP